MAPCDVTAVPKQLNCRGRQFWPPEGRSGLPGARGQPATAARFCADDAWVDDARVDEYPPNSGAGIYLGGPAVVLGYIVEIWAESPRPVVGGITAVILAIEAAARVGMSLCGVDICWAALQSFWGRLDGIPAGIVVVAWYYRRWC